MDYDAHLARGQEYFLEKGDYDAAIRDFDSAIVMRPMRLPQYYDRGKVHFAKGDYDAAMRDLNKADPKHSAMSREELRCALGISANTNGKRAIC